MRIRGTTFALALLWACGSNGSGGDGSNGTNVTGGSSNDCDNTDPGGKSCLDPRECVVKCSCEGGTVTAATCDGTCGMATDMCERACANAKVGAFKKRYCFVGQDRVDAGQDAGSGLDAGASADGGDKGGDGNSSGSSGPGCVPFAAPCRTSDDCCSQACDAVFKTCD